MIYYKIMQNREFREVSQILFDILYSNMSIIAPTGNEYEEDYLIWYQAVSHELSNKTHQIIIITDDNKIIGYFKYCINNKTFIMEDIQLKKEYHKKGVFQKLYSLLYEIIPKETIFAEAYVSKQNKKSQGILKHLGLSIIGEHKNKKSYILRGNCCDILNRYNTREQAVKEISLQIEQILKYSSPSIYLYGSMTLGDFRFGWSDIDILVLTNKKISSDEAQKLLNLRSSMLNKDPCNLYYRLFEGGFLSLNSFLTGNSDNVVYWGSGKERITDTYKLNSFDIAELIESGILIYGCDIRSQLNMPSFNELYADIKCHYENIRKYAHRTGRSIHSFGWMLDIARCIYTLQTGKIITKTSAADWALKNNLCPDPDILKIALDIRTTPFVYKDDDQILSYAEMLGNPIQRFADILEKQLERFKG